MKIQEIKYADILIDNEIKYPNKIALCSDNQNYTYKELNRITDIYAANLLDMGIKKGDHVVIWGCNSANWFINFISIIKSGAVAVLMNYSISAKDVIDLIKLSDAKYIFYGNNKAVASDPDALVKISENTGIPNKNIISIGNNDKKYKELLNFNNESKKIKETSVNDDPRRTAVIIFTTGTTAVPKAVMLSQYSIINDANGFGANYISRRGTSLYNALPLFHSYGLSMVTSYMYDGLTIYLNEVIAPSVIAESIKEYKPTDMAGVGSVYSALMECENFENDIMPYIKTCILGGSVSTPTFVANLENKFKNTKFLTGYGLTEASPVLSVCTPDASVEKRSQSVGKILPLAEVKVWSEKQGFMPTGEIGEVVARGYFLMNGYYKMPADQQPIDADGWLHTGDLGYLDEENFLYLTGRIKDIINKKGENISPVEIEQKIMENPAIKEVKVMGAPHHTMGESIEACIVLHKDAVFSEKKMIDELRMKISHFKIPDHFWIFDSFPLSGNGKLDQRKLKEQMLQRLSTTL